MATESPGLGVPGVRRTVQRRPSLPVLARLSRHCCHAPWHLRPQISYSPQCEAHRHLRRRPLRQSTPGITQGSGVKREPGRLGHGLDLNQALNCPLNHPTGSQMKGRIAQMVLNTFRLRTNLSASDLQVYIREVCGVQQRPEEITTTLRSPLASPPWHALLPQQSAVRCGRSQSSSASAAGASAVPHRWTPSPAWQPRAPPSRPSLGPSWPRAQAHERLAVLRWTHGSHSAPAAVGRRWSSPSWHLN